jgi:hypothetical protein
MLWIHIHLFFKKEIYSLMITTKAIITALNCEENKMSAEEKEQEKETDNTLTWREKWRLRSMKNFRLDWFMKLFVKME